MRTRDVAITSGEYSERDSNKTNKQTGILKYEDMSSKALRGQGIKSSERCPFSKHRLVIRLFETSWRVWIYRAPQLRYP